jgi:nucleolar complex protein 3
LNSCYAFENQIDDFNMPADGHLKSESKSEIDLLILGFELMFYRRKHVPKDRICSFVKRLSTMALVMPTNSLLACLSMLRSLLIRFPHLDCLLDNESRLGNGVYSPYLDDPDLCNSFATNLWELSILQVNT